ncbi:MAG: hypothetical protein B6247_17205 [Candidatus Parabeggiatoa sp. nov. 2]|nr:MAG: hypothetical protein B6247_17205 [Beggiatoa sp. 4572_84]
MVVFRLLDDQVDSSPTVCSRRFIAYRLVAFLQRKTRFGQTEGRKLWAISHNGSTDLKSWPSLQRALNFWTEAAKLKTTLKFRGAKL